MQGESQKGSEDQLPIPTRIERRHRLARSAAACIIIASSLFPWAEAEGADQRSPFSAPPGCEEISPPGPLKQKNFEEEFSELVTQSSPESSETTTPSQPVEPDTTDHAFEDVVTSALKVNFRPWHLVNLPAMGLQMAKYKPIESFKLQDSGIGLVIWTDGTPDFEINKDAFNELLTAPLLLHDQYNNPQLRDIMRCYKEKIVDERAYEDRVVHFFISSDPARCIKSMRLATRKHGNSFDDDCAFRGFTFPKEFKLPGGNKNHSLIISAPGVTEGIPYAEQAWAQNISHEFKHLIKALFNEPIRIDEDETAVRITDKEFRIISGRPLPKPLVFIDTQ